MAVSQRATITRPVFAFETILPGGYGTENRLDTAWFLPPVIVDQIEIFLPPGSQSEFKVALGYGGGRLLPWDDPSEYIFGAPLNRVYEVGFPVTEKLDVTLINTGWFDHQVIMRAYCRWLVGAGDVARPNLILPV